MKVMEMAGGRRGGAQGRQTWLGSAHAQLRRPSMALSASSMALVLRIYKIK